MKHIFQILLAISISLLVACASTGTRRNIEGPVAVDTSQSEVDESQLLNASIELFDPGALPEKEKEANGLSMEIRNAEARYMPEQLRATMEKTGHWGAVRVVPKGISDGELTISGTILESNGAELELQISARDASGRQWFNNIYHDEVEAIFYQVNDATEEAFQPLYNSIANDLARFLKKLPTTDITTIRRIAELQFAADIAPDAFADYLQTGENDENIIVHLPSLDDPMYGRVQAIRERDLLMIDTLNGHFDNFHREMQQPYTEWRKARSDEALKLKELERAALNRTLLGIAAIAGAIFIGASSNGYDQGTDVLTDVLVLGGAAALKSGADKRSEAVIHRDSIEELGSSFTSEAKPLVVEVDGKTVELTGSAETQYEQWRDLIGQIYSAETGNIDSSE